MEAGIPVAGAPEAMEGVSFARIPAITALVGTYTGPYDRLGKAWSCVKEHARKEGVEIDHSISAWEQYITDPGSEPDPCKWVTKIFMPTRS